jgi:iron complex outermembrane receptor protein
MSYSKLPIVLFLAAGYVAGSGLHAQTTAPAPTNETSTDETIVLSPFDVTTDKDKGYHATNATSGTRLNTEIKDLPMPLEVITDEFIRDTGANNLRQALKYSAGILTQTQNDYGAGPGDYDVSPGRVNNPEGLTADPNESTFKIRGFPTTSVLRDGFRRQAGTDTVNISRVEVARGPASLLYGVGNFGGVVNYLPKLPSMKAAQEVSLAIGSYDFKRATIDLTGPLSESKGLAFRLTGAYEDTHSYTDFNTERHYFVSPVVTWRPFTNTEVTLDLEYGKQWLEGIGWQTLRAATALGVNDAAGYDANFLRLPGKNIRTFRWSGPDTYRDSATENIEVKVKQKLADNLFLMAGVNHSNYDFQQLDNMATLHTADSSTPAWAISPVQYVGLIDTQANVPAGPVPSTIVYEWERMHQQNAKDQARIELTYDLKLFQNSSKWLKLDNSFLAGFSYSVEKLDSHSSRTPADKVNFHSPADLSYLRFGYQGDGSPDAAMMEYQNTDSKTSNPAEYAVYQGKLLDGRVTLIGGVRKDSSWNNVLTYNPQFLSTGAKQSNAYSSPVDTASPRNKNTTYQYGVNVELTRSLSVYAMHSEGVEPNYQGKIDLLGHALNAALAKDNEVGVKFDFLNGRISGTISKFQIDRTGVQVGNAGAVWYVPILAAKQAFDPNKDVVFRVDKLDPYNRYAGDTSPVFQRNKAIWDQAEAAGAIYTKTTALGTHLYLDATKTYGGKALGAEVLDAYWSDSAKSGDWYGWLWDGSDPGSKPFDPETNNATMDDNGAQTRVATGNDRSKGWDTQILLSPTDNFQILLSYARTEKTVVSSAVWPRYPYLQDRWAIWLAPNWPVYNTPASPTFRDQSDTSTHIQFGEGLALDDTPKDQAAAWANYSFSKQSSLKGLSIGAGATYEGARSIYPSYGEQARDKSGNIIFLSTRPKTIYNAMVKYTFLLGGRESSIQLNVDNVLDNQKLYGFVYQAPRRWQIEFNHKL